MGFIADIFTGGSDDAADASVEAARIQATSADQAAAVQAAGLAESTRIQKEALDQSRADLKPFADEGKHALPGLRRLVRDPTDRRNFVANNPFFKFLADDAQRRIFQNKAARGKVGSGETADALQRSLFEIGPQILDRAIGQQFNLATLGSNAAAGQATATQNTARSISDATLGSNRGIADLVTQRANAGAAGIVGASNARSQGLSNTRNTLLGIGGLILSDIRAKTDIEPFGKTLEGINIYKYRYRGTPDLQVGVMAQEVENVKPEAVVTIGGVKHVDYEVLGSEPIPEQRMGA